MTRHVVIVTGAHLCRNPRVVKEAEALSEAGYRVTVLRPVLSQSLEDLDAELTANAHWHVETTVDLTAGRISPMWERLARRVGTEAARRGIELPDALGYGVRKTLRLARSIKADLYIGHQEVGLWVVNRLAEQGLQVGVDFEDWYSEDLLPEARQARPLRLLRREEGAAVRRGGHVTTTSEALAKALAETYVGPEPTVVYNAFPWSDRATLGGQCSDRKDLTRPSLHWVSQTVGPGRGLDTLCLALQQVERPVEVHLRGRAAPSDEVWLREQFPDEIGHRLYLHGLVQPAELLRRISEHDIGLALEAYEPPSRDLTVTNKILHYLVAGLAVVATDTAGQIEVASHAPDAVRLCRGGDAASMAAQINALVGESGVLERTKVSALEAARERFCWEAQAPALVSSVDAALGHTPAEEARRNFAYPSGPPADSAARSSPSSEGSSKTV